MGTTNQARFKINGVIDTAKPVMQNIENITNSLTSWLTYDQTDGKWAIIINRAGTSSFSFDDSNIVGAVNVGGTGMDRLYNAVEVQFPNRDLDDANDYIRLDLLPAERKVNEPDNLLKLTYPLINDPITAQQIGLQELLQSRVETTIDFNADYSALSVKAGEIVSVTNSAHGYTNKLFRVVKTEEVNSGGAMQIKISGIEYDASVYAGNFNRVTRSNADGVITIGEIGKMSTPQITRIGSVPNGVSPGAGETRHDPQPRILIESTVPDNTDPLNQAGIIEGVEVWYYDIPDTELSTTGTGNEWQAVDDEARTYKLHSVYKPNPKDVFDPGEELDIYIEEFTNRNTGFSGNFLIKLRAVNSTTAGPYSDKSGLVQYGPTQKTQRVDGETEWFDETTPLSGMCHPSKLPVTHIDSISNVYGYDICVIQQNEGLSGTNCAYVQLIPCAKNWGEEIL